MDSEEMQRLKEAIGRRIQEKQDELFLGPIAFTEAPSPPASELKTEDLLALMGRLRAEQRWLGGRQVRAFKVGRAQLDYCRRHMARNASYSGPSLTLGTHLYGIPFYEVGRADYLEPIYQDEAPTLEVLNERLMAEPAVVGGRLVRAED